MDTIFSLLRVVNILRSAQAWNGGRSQNSLSPSKSSVLSNTQPCIQSVFAAVHHHPLFIVMIII